MRYGRFGKHRTGKRGRWRVIYGGARAGGMNVQAQVHTYPTRRRARNVARQVQGTRVHGPRRLRLPRRLAWAAAFGLIALGLCLIGHALGV